MEGSSIIRITFEGNFCDISKCRKIPGSSSCVDGYCSQRMVWERLKLYEDALEKGHISITRVALWQRIWALRKPFPECQWWITEATVTAISTEGFRLSCSSLDDWIPYSAIGNGYYLTETEAQEALGKVVKSEFI